MSFLKGIYAHKKKEVAAARVKLPDKILATRARATPEPPDFILALQDRHRPRPRLIAEIKRRSPSKGILRQELQAQDLAQIYASNGAAAVSVLTDRTYFDGCLDDLRLIADLSLGLPLLRKDFILDRYQLLEARQCGASAVLLIVAMLDPATLQALLADAVDLGLTPLVEVHTEAELDVAIGFGAELIGINNRDLHTFQVSLETTERLAPLIPPGSTVVAESGIRTGSDIDRLVAAGVDAMLVGESLVTSSDIPTTVRQLARVPAKLDLESPQSPSASQPA